MPLFGKKKTDAEKKAEEAKKQEAAGSSGYPRQQVGAGPSTYPTQPPPAYYVQQPLPGQQYVVPQGPPMAYSAPGAPPPYQSVQPMYVCQESSFAAGARFGPGHGSQPIIPPPPPGVMPNMAQYAAAQGHSVTVSQHPETIMDGTGHGGTVLW
uniref:DAZ-associated protein 2 n=1 Tax=Plectus sambesii TaxID=2011161 RepID=A0A914V7S9_9BILA